MSETNPTGPRPQRRRPVIGATAIGLAFGSGAFGVARDGEPDPTADPVPAPPMTQPKDDPAVWSAVTGASAATPAAKEMPSAKDKESAAAVDPPAIPVLPKPPSLDGTPRPPAGSPASGPAVPVLPPPSGTVPAEPQWFPTLPAPTPVTPTTPQLPPPDLGSPKLPPDLGLPKLPDPPALKPTTPVPAKPAAELPGPVTPPAPQTPPPDLGDLGAFKIAPAEPSRPAPPELPAPSSKLPVEVAPASRPVKSADPAQPGEVRPPEFRLRPTPPGLNVNSNGGAAPTPEPGPSGFDGFAVPTPAPVPPPTAPGDTPMPSPRHLALSAALGVALAAPAVPVRAEDPKPMAPAAKAEDVKNLQSVVETVKTEVTELKRSNEYLKDVLLGSGDGKKTGQEVMTRLDNLETKLKTIESALARIETALKDPTRSTSAYGSPAPTPGASNPTSGRATVRLVNDYPTDVSMIVNGRSYRLTPNEVRTVEVPGGSYTYELLSAGGQPKTAAIKDGETVTLRIN